jgi:hypothetical protein
VVLPLVLIAIFIGWLYVRHRRRAKRDKRRGEFAEKELLNLSFVAARDKAGREGNPPAE